MDELALSRRGEPAGFSTSLQPDGRATQHPKI
jgi:hypothetical protein